jgi:hypothetical protein
MKIKKILIMIVLAVTLLGCGKREPRHIVIMPDVSGSIERESLQKAFKAIDELASHLQRGDKLIVIPILGDAEAEASGRILRFEVPANRQAYDTDLRNFRHKLSLALAEMDAHAATHPGSKTDILGSVELAEQEFKLGTGQSKRLLVVLSDFIQDDSKFDFRLDSHLKDQTDVQSFAHAEVKSTGIRLKAVPVYLGLLRSREYGALDLRRRAAIQTFWIHYFIAAGAQPEFVFDGLRLLEFP